MSHLIVYLKPEKEEVKQLKGRTNLNSKPKLNNMWVGKTQFTQQTTNTPCQNYNPIPELEDSNWQLNALHYITIKRMLKLM